MRLWVQRCTAFAPVFPVSRGRRCRWCSVRARTRRPGGRGREARARVVAAPRKPPGPHTGSLRREAGACGRRRRRSEGRWRPWSSSGSPRRSTTPPSPLSWTTTSARVATSAPCRRISSSTFTTRYDRPARSDPAAAPGPHPLPRPRPGPQPSRQGPL